MIYLDNAATSWPKPEGVYQALAEFLRNTGGNPGRGAHQMAQEASRAIYRTRQRLAEFLGASRPEEIVFTSSATEALNLAIKGILAPGDHVITSSMEHNSVARPLMALQEQGVEVTVIPCSPRGELSPGAVAAALRPNTRLVALSHASNVTGTIFPVEEIAATLHLRERGVLLLVDAAQSAGELPLNLQRTPIDLLAFPGHKGLLGPPGTGGLFIREGLRLRPLKEGGTGSESELPHQPETIPDRYESGTLNSVGIVALGEGVAFLQEMGLEKVRRHQLALQRRLREGLRGIEGLELYGPEDPERRVGILSLNVRHLSPAEVAFILDQAYGIAVRAGLHCAPWAHRTLGTFPRGAVRISTGCFTREEEIDALVKALAEIARAAV